MKSWIYLDFMHLGSTKKENGFVFLTHGDFSVFENAGHIQSKNLKQVNQLKSH